MLLPNIVITKFCEQLQKSGEVEVVERGDVVIGLTGDFKNPYYDDEDDIDDKCEDNTQAGNLEASGTNDARLQFRPFVENRWDCPVCWQTKKCFCSTFS